MSRLGAPGSVALAFALVASLAPSGAAARAQSVTKQAPIPVAEDAPVYVLTQGPDGDASCRLDTRGEFRAADGLQEVPVHQINHLDGKGAATASDSAGLIIVLRGTARLDLPENAAAKAAFIAAAAKWEALVSTQITVTIDVDYGPDFFGQPYSSSNTLGATSMGGFIPSYSTVRGRLVNNAPAGSEERTLLNSLPATSLPTDIGDVPTIFVSRAQALALGLNISETGGIPRIGFNSNFAFDFNPADGINSTQTDFDAVAVHEIGHALGFTSRVGSRELNPSEQLLASLWDIYRFRPGITAGAFSTAPRVLSSGTTETDPHVYFSGAAELRLSTGRPNSEGGDGEQSSHWRDDRFGGGFIGIMDPTIPRGRREQITANDLRALDFFGYSLGGTPPPPPPPAPANDNFAAAQTISGSTGSTTGTNVGATSESGEPNHSPASDAGGKSVWYNWTAPSNGPVTFVTAGSDYDTVLAAYTGASISSLAAIIKNDDVDPGVVRTSTITFNATGGTVYRIAVDGWDGDEGNITLNWTHTPTGGGQGATVQLSTTGLSVGEGEGRATLTVTRAGDTNAVVTVDYRTTDADAFTVGCANAAGAAGNAFARCDFATAAGTLRFNVGETQKQITVPIIDDGHVEGAQTFHVALSDASGGTLGTTNVATVTIVDNDAAGAPNPVMNSSPFFVRQQYLDFLSREPDQGGLNAWLGVLNGCQPNIFTGPEVQSGCDRIFVSGEGFYRSVEFQTKGAYAFRFYKVAFNRLPEYLEIVTDMSFVAGATQQEVFARKAELASRFANRQEFATAFGGMTNAQYVSTLLGRYGLAQVTTPDPANPDTGGKVVLTGAELTSRLTAGTLTRAQVLRAVADADEVGAAEFNNTFVAMQYYGYLRRKPEPAGYEAWLNVLRSGDVRTMVNGFLNSAEYKLRFGQQ